MIKSKFYLIRGDGKPIYVGFTNRPIKQRFSEHKAGKDFSGYEKVTIEKIDESDYEFTWNENILYKNANEVSVRENQLIIKYGTQDSKYQKAIGGGQVWTYEKYFVRNNQNNPKFLGMSGDEIEKYVELENDRIQKLWGYISNTIPRHLRKQKDYIRDTMSIHLRKQKDYIGSTKPIHLTKQNNYIEHTKPTNLTKQNNYIGSTIPSHLSKQKSYISHTIPSHLSKQKSYISMVIPSYLRKQKNYIQDTIPRHLIKQKSYVRNTLPSYLIKQNHYIGNTRS